MTRGEQSSPPNPHTVCQSVLSYTPSQQWRRLDPEQHSYQSQGLPTTPRASSPEPTVSTSTGPHPRKAAKGHTPDLPCSPHLASVTYGSGLFLSGGCPSPTPAPALSFLDLWQALSLVHMAHWAVLTVAYLKWPWIRGVGLSGASEPCLPTQGNLLHQCSWLVVSC